MISKKKRTVNLNTAQQVTYIKYYFTQNYYICYIEKNPLLRGDSLWKPKIIEIFY